MTDSSQQNGATLPEPFDEDPAEQELREAYRRTIEAEEAAIGTAFARRLLPALPADMRRFSQGVFRGAAAPDAALRRALLAETSVRAAGGAGRDLARCGLTPVMIAGAAQGVANLARRGAEGTGDVLLRTLGARGTGEGLVLPRRSAIREIMLMIETDLDHAARLFDWLAKAALTVPGIFPGFDARPSPEGLRLRRTDLEEDLAALWTRGRAAQDC